MSMTADDVCTFDLRPLIDEAISKIHVAVEAGTVVKVVAALEDLGYTVIPPQSDDPNRED